MDKDTEQKIPTEDKPFKLTTGWTPPATQDMYFDNYRKFTHQELMQELSKPPEIQQIQPHQKRETSHQIFISKPRYHHKTCR